MITNDPYTRLIGVQKVDIYDIIHAYGITNPATAHAIKKLLRNGNGKKSAVEDLFEAKASIARAIEIEAKKRTS